MSTTSRRRPPPPPDSVPSRRTKKIRSISWSQAESLINSCDAVIESANETLQQARDVAGKYGRTIESELTRYLRNEESAVASATTAGHSNTDHVISWTGDFVTDRTAELKRNMLNRVRSQRPESKGEDRWDKPRAPGERRRRIRREKDMPDAPIEPPLSGYIAFVAQMTTKIRHDRPKELHDQTAVVQEISKMWRIALSDEDREFYNTFSDQMRKEYAKLHMEYRATGQFTPSERFEKMGDGAGPWVHKLEHEKSQLEREISGYDSVVFPPRPPEFDEDYQKRFEASKLKRKLKLKSLNEDRKKQKCLDDVGKEKPQTSLDDVGKEEKHEGLDGGGKEKHQEGMNEDGAERHVGNFDEDGAGKTIEALNVDGTEKQQETRGLEEHQTGLK